MEANTVRKKNLGEPGNGGEFGRRRRHDGDVTLDTITAAEPYTVRPTRAAGEFIIGNNITDPEPTFLGHGIVRLTHPHRDDPVVLAQQLPIAATYTHAECEAAQDEASRLARAGEKMTLLLIDEVGRVTGWEVIGTGTDVPSVMSKGARRTRYYRYLPNLPIAAVAAGHGRVRALAAEYNRRADCVLNA